MGSGINVLPASYIHFCEFKITYVNYRDLTAGCQQLSENHDKCHVQHMQLQVGVDDHFDYFTGNHQIQSRFHLLQRQLTVEERRQVDLA
jgi:hypothetical protein